MDDKKENSYLHILKYTGLFGSVQGLGILVGVLRNKFTALFLGPSGMGLLSLFSSTISVLSSACNFGIPTSGVKFISEKEHAADESQSEKADIAGAVLLVRTYSLLAAFFGAFVCVLLGPLLNGFTFSWGNHTLHFILLAPTIFFTILAGGETAILKATGQLRALAMQASLLAILLLLVSVPVYWIFGERGILPVLFILAFMQWALNFRYSRRVVRWGVNMRKMTLVAGFPLLRLGGAFVLSGLMNSGCEFLIRAFLNQQGDLEVVGLFNAGITIVFVYAGMVFSVMDQDFYPRLSGISGSRKNEESVKERNLCVNRQLEMNVLLLGPIVAAIILGLPLIIPILYNAQFMGMLQMTQLAAVAMLFKAVYLPIEYLPLSRGDSRLFLIQESFCVILLIICEIAGYQLDGLRGVGGGIAVAYAIETLAVLAFSRAVYGYRLSALGFRFSIFQLLILLLVLFLVFMICYRDWLYWLIGVIIALMSTSFSFRKIRKLVR